MPNFGVDSIYCSAGVAFMRSVVKLIAGLCLLLTVVSAYIFATHHHSNSLSESQCTVCVVAHSASPVVAPTTPSAVPVVLRLIVVGEPITSEQRVIAFALSVRPPPVV